MRRAVLILALALAGACAGAAPAGPPLRLTLPALDGGEVDLARYRGRVVVLHLFETGSTAAVGDVDQLVALAGDRRIVVIGVALDAAGRPVVAPFRRALRLPYLVTLAHPDELADSPLGAVRVVPTTIVLDRDGRVARRLEHPLGRGELKAALAPLVAGGR